jgi:hypothetical protein
LVVDECSVAASEVLHTDIGWFNAKKAMPTRNVLMDPVIWHTDLTIRVATDDAGRPFLEDKFLFFLPAFLDGEDYLSGHRELLSEPIS